MNTIHIYKVMVVAMILGTASICSAVEGTWTRKANMPTARLGFSASTVNGKIYAIGGGNSIDGTAFRTVEEYDPATDTWTRKADMSMPRFFHCAGVVNDKIYIIGGATGPNLFTPMVEEYDPATDTWQRKSSMPTTRGMLAASVLGDKIYVIGGAADTQTSMSVVEQYDPLSDTWTQKAEIPTARSMLSASAMDGKIYAMGGAQGLMGGPGVSIVEEYDPVNDTWMRKTDMPTARKNLSTFALSGKIYAVGGGTNIYGPTYTALEEYDPKTDTWATKPAMPTARGFISASVLDGNVYVIGGTLGDPHVAVSIVEEYNIRFNSPSPDFNGDGIVDAKDMCIMVDNWLSEDPWCDIAPPPLGDGIVDVQDLVLLSEHLFEEILPPELVAYWKFDETEGAIAYELAGGNDGYLIGDPIWQLDEGIKDGALQFDGINDYVLSTFNLNPAQGPFSVFAWIKGGTPGQVIISQMDGTGSGDTWLGIDPLNGCLMTGLVSPPIGRFIAEPLESNYIMTDDIWHHIGFVWDGSYRTLYVDGMEVSKDTNPLTSLKNSDGAILIGVNKNLDTGTYFSGLIDDVRVYSKVLTAERIAVLAQ
ncbi:kelch repeat-containing protein [Planctomycetota bacterium]